MIISTIIALIGSATNGGTVSGNLILKPCSSRKWISSGTINPTTIAHIKPFAPKNPKSNAPSTILALTIPKKIKDTTSAFTGRIFSSSHAANVTPNNVNSETIPMVIWYARFNHSALFAENDLHASTNPPVIFAVNGGVINNMKIEPATVAPNPAVTPFCMALINFKFVNFVTRGMSLSPTEFFIFSFHYS